MQTRTALAIYSACLLLLSSQQLDAQISLSKGVIDSTMAGDIKIAADIDGDGFKDLIVGGGPGEDLDWYHYPSWTKTRIALANIEFTTDGDAADMDGDGDIDIVAPDGNGSNNLVWFENPRLGASGNGDPFDTSKWRRRVVGTPGGWAKDVELADFDGNGLMDIATRTDSRAVFFFQNSPNTWSQVTFTPTGLGIEGMASGDVDNDGDVDLVIQGAWLRNPGGPSAHTAASWQRFAIGSAPSEFKALVVNIDADPAKEILFSSSESTADVTLWDPASGDPTGSWTSRVIASSVERAHTLQAADMDRDGDVDVIVGQMHTSATKQLAIYLNSGTSPATWSKQVVDQTSGLHNGVVADIGNDGDYDIFGANWTTNPPVLLYTNTTPASAPAPAPVEPWRYIRVTSANAQTFGLAFGDINRDGRKDIVSGRYWYRNPGGELTGAWTQSAAFPNSVHAVLTMDVDSDSLSDVIATKTEGSRLVLYWLEATNSAGTAWNAVNIGSVPAASHTLGSQGYRTANVRPGGQQEILISSLGGIWYFQVPASPATNAWTSVQVSANPSDEGFDVVDVNRDGYLDVVAGTGDSKRVEWYRNPGTGGSYWTSVVVGNMNEAVYPDRFASADLNGDGRVDIVATEENGQTSGARTFWWQAPGDPTTPNWTRRTLTTQGTTNSLDLADMDADGDIDIVLGEHRGSLKMAYWKNSGTGTFSERVVGTGNESHLGGRVVDIDGDGDQDIVSIAWDAPQNLHLWRNDAITGGGPVDSTPPSISAVTTSAVTASGATITWTTNEPADSRVEYGVTTTYGSTTGTNTTLTTSHSRTLSGLSAGTTYHYRARSVDAAGNASVGGDHTFTTLAGAQTPPPSTPPPSGLRAQWLLDEGAGTTAADATGNGNVATLVNGPVWTSGVRGYALAFDGSNDYIAIPPLDITGAAMTIAGWVRFSSFPANVDQRIVSKANGSAESSHWWMLGQINSGGQRLRFRLKTGSTTTTLVASSGNLAANTWYHVAAVYDGSAMRLYLNGTQVGSVAKTGTIATSSSVTANIGRNPDAYGYLSGALDDVRIYQRALSASEIATVMSGQ